MQAVGLHQAVIQCHAVEQERHQGDVELLRELRVHRRERIGIPWPVVGRHLDADEQQPCPALLHGADHRGQVRARVLDGQSAQAVVGAEFQDHDLRLVGVECAPEAVPATRRGLAADAGIHYLVTVTLLAEPVLQAGDPAFLGLQAVGRAEAVAEHEQGALLGSAGGGAPDRQQRE